MRRGGRNIFLFSILAVAAIALFISLLMFGQVSIPAGIVLDILAGKETGHPSWETIIFQSRLPMAITALLAGCALSTSGLILQTTFHNPLAGPSILGISAGASLGVACVLLLFAVFPSAMPSVSEIGTLAGALTGAGIIILILTALSSVLKSSLALLIAGILISYLASSIISILNTFAPSEAVRSFVVWGLGSYAGVTIDNMAPFAVTVAVAVGAGVFFLKPLDASLLGDRYLRTMGYNATAVRTLLLTLSAVQTAVITAYCGPIGFIGLVVPHIARMIFSTSSHFILYPASLLCGASVSLTATLLSVLPSGAGVIPINAITPVIGVPVIIYIMLNSRKLKYFN